MITLVVTVMENTSCKVTECYLYRGPDNDETRARAEEGFIKQIEDVQNELNADQRAHYLEQGYYPGSYYTVCLVGSLEVHAGKEVTQQKVTRKKKKIVKKKKKKAKKK